MGSGEGLLLDSLCLLLIDYFHPLHNGWSAARTAGVLVRDMANMVNSKLLHKTSNLIFLIWSVVMDLTPEITSLCAYFFSLLSSSLRYLFSPFPISAVSPELVAWVRKAGTIQQKQQLTVQERQSVCPAGCTERCPF